jgi:hypothetical protein
MNRKMEHRTMQKLLLPLHFCSFAKETSHLDISTLRFNGCLGELLVSEQKNDLLRTGKREVRENEKRLKCSCSRAPPARSGEAAASF